MTYPAASDWTSNTPFSAWYVESRSGQPSKVCQTDGWNFLRDLQDQLHTRLQDAGPFLGPSGMPVSADDVVVNDIAGPQVGWNGTLLNALYAVARHDNAPAAYLSSVSADAAGSTIGPATLSTAIWEAYLNSSQTASGDFQYGAGSPDEARIPSGAVLPNWGLPPQPPSNQAVSSGLTCRAVPSVPDLQPIPGDTLSFIHNPWVLIGVLAVATVGVVVAARNIPVIPRQNPSRRRRRSWNL